MTNRKLFEEAIADAKSVRDAAVANAKAALEETFTPKIMSMLANKLNEMDEDLDKCFQLFPRLKERVGQAGGTLSGGEQQMLAIGRALMARPKVLLLDEPSMGLAPMMIQNIFNIITEINKAGTTILLVEQNAQQALQRAHRAYVLETGKVVKEAKASDLLNDPAVREAYLGTGAH